MRVMRTDALMPAHGWTGSRRAADVCMRVCLLGMSFMCLLLLRVEEANFRDIPFDPLGAMPCASLLTDGPMANQNLSMDCKTGIH